jgi:hypothetical protein
MGLEVRCILVNDIGGHRTHSLLVKGVPEDRQKYDPEKLRDLGAGNHILRLEGIVMSLRINAAP